MGNIGKKLYSALTPTPKPIKIFIDGLNKSGKTTILQKLNLNQIVSSTPTLAFNIWTLTLNQTPLELWDGGEGRIGGGFMIRPLLKDYFEGVQGVVYVVGDQGDRLQAVGKDLWEFYLRHLDGKVPVLVFLNKEDLGEVDQRRVREELEAVAPGWNMHYQVCSATKGNGIIQGFSWLIDSIKQIDHNK